jgi:excinuclease UvrABC nuclease subunit
VIGDSKGFAWTEAAIKEYAPATSGVYAVYNGLAWVYVGESRNIQEQLLQHIRSDNDCISGSLPIGFQFEVSNEQERIRRRQELIARLHPACDD